MAAAKAPTKGQLARRLLELNSGPGRFFKRFSHVLLNLFKQTRSIFHRRSGKVACRAALTVLCRGPPGTAVVVAGGARETKMLVQPAVSTRASIAAKKQEAMKRSFGV